jgi:hypothetical protein
MMRVGNNQIKTMNCVARQFAKEFRQGPLLFVHRTFILLRCGKPFAANAVFGVSSLDLGRLFQRGRPFFLGCCRHSRGLKFEVLTDEICCDTSLDGGKPLAVNALLGRFLP